MLDVIGAGLEAGLLEINPECTISLVDLFEDYRCVVVDNFLVDPERLIAYAQSRAGDFTESIRAYPGPEFMLPNAAVAGFDRWWRRKLCAPLGLLRGGAASKARFSIVTKRPEELSLPRRFCHQDPLTEKSGAGCVGIAGVLYLFRNLQLGGTAFYRKREGSSFAEINELFRQGRHAELAAKYPFFFKPPRYMVDSNELFERVCAIEAAFNRAIFYDRSIFHGPDFRHPELVSPSFSDGRLTVNFFVEAYRASPAAGVLHRR